MFPLILHLSTSTPAPYSLQRPGSHQQLNQTNQLQHTTVRHPRPPSLPIQGSQHSTVHQPGARGTLHWSWTAGATLRHVFLPSSSDTHVGAASQDSLSCWAVRDLTRMGEFGSGLGSPTPRWTIIIADISLAPFCYEHKVVVAFSTCERVWGEGSANHFPPVLFFFFC